MRNKYAELFKEITPQKWKEICDECLTSTNLKRYFLENYNIELTKSAIYEYSKKFQYKCPLHGKIKDERGHKYGKLLVKSFAGFNDRKEALWHYQCDCGEIEVRSGAVLRQAKINTSMCKKCLAKNVSERRWKDLSNTVINSLLVIERIGTAKNGSPLYKCRCLNCGNILTIQATHLTDNSQISCGCINSKGEYLIRQILQSLNMEYATQYTFSDCKDKKVLRFDFAIFKDSQLKCLIEFQGQQHYQKATGSWCDTDETFQERQNRDNIKREYCKNKNIPLIEISYKELSKLNKDYLLKLLQPIL